MNGCQWASAPRKSSSPQACAGCWLPRYRLPRQLSTPLSQRQRFPCTPVDTRVSAEVVSYSVSPRAARPALSGPSFSNALPVSLTVLYVVREGQHVLACVCTTTCGYGAFTGSPICSTAFELYGRAMMRPSGPDIQVSNVCTVVFKRCAVEGTGSRQNPWVLAT